MLLTAILVGASTQAATAARVPDPTRFAELIRTTNALPAFVVEYQAIVGGQEAPSTVRVLYRAPDRTKIVLGTETVFRIQEGTVDVRISGAGEKAMTAHVPIAEANRERLERIAAVIRAEFPACADQWSASGGEGIRFDLEVRDSSNPAEKSLQFMASTASAGTLLFGWLEDLSTKTGSPADGGRIVFEEPDGSKITLSTRTGFIEKVERSRSGGVSTFQIASLDLAPELEDSAFDLPPPAFDATDASTLFAERLQRIHTQTLRKRAWTSCARLAVEKKIGWGPAARASFAKVLEAIHESAWRLENVVWVTDMRRRMGEFATWFRDRLRDPALAVPGARQRIEESVPEWRQSLAESAASGLDPRLSSLSIEPEEISDEVLRKDILDLEREVVKSTLQSALVEPLLREFDEKIAQARRTP